MAKDFAVKFYNSSAWKECREAYKSYRHYLCERCLSRGLYKPGRIVHHKKRITPETVDDPSITLNFCNLELLCSECHEAEHRPERQKKEHDRYYIGDDGKIFIKSDD